MDLGELFDQIVESSRQKASTTTCSPTPTSRKLRLREEPAPRFLPRLARSLHLIDPSLRAFLRQLVSGLLPWPLFLHGAAGVGKTSAALCLLDYAHGDASRYLTVAGLADEVLEAAKGRLEWNREGMGGTITVPKLWQMLAKADLVVLDELGLRDRASEWQYECVKRLLDERLGMPTILIANLGLKEMGRIYDDRVASRIGEGTIFILASEDRRIARRVKPPKPCPPAS